jgi:hypothetical protein
MTTIPLPSTAATLPVQRERIGVVQRALTILRNAYHGGMPGHRLRRYVGDGADIRTYTLVRERLCLFDEATAALLHPQATGRVVEVGSYLGASAVVLAEALRREHSAAGRLFCIDTWQNDAMSEGQRYTFEQFCGNTQRWRRWIEPIVGRSDAVAMPHETFDLVFIDGDHSYEAATADIHRLAPRVAKHGRLVLHDHCSKPGVGRTLGELLAGGQWVIHRCIDSLVSLKRAPWAMP